MNAIDLYDKPGVYPKPRKSGRIPYFQTFHDCGGRLKIYWKNAVCRIDFFRVNEKTPLQCTRVFALPHIHKVLDDRGQFFVCFSETQFYCQAFQYICPSGSLSLTHM